MHKTFVIWILINRIKQWQKNLPARKKSLRIPLVTDSHVRCWKSHDNLTETLFSPIQIRTTIQVIQAWHHTGLGSSSLLHNNVLPKTSVNFKLKPWLFFQNWKKRYKFVYAVIEITCWSNNHDWDFVIENVCIVTKTILAQFHPYQKLILGCCLLIPRVEYVFWIFVIPNILLNRA